MLMIEKEFGWVSLYRCDGRPGKLQPHWRPVCVYQNLWAVCGGNGGTGAGSYQDCLRRESHVYLRIKRKRQN